MSYCYIIKLDFFHIKLYKLITEKYRPEPGIKPQASCLTYERSTTELSRSIQFRSLNLGFILITLVSYRMRSATLEPYLVCGGAGVVPVCRLLQTYQKSHGIRHVIPFNLLYTPHRLHLYMY